MNNDLRSIAVKIAADSDIEIDEFLESDTEYSVNMEISISVQFDGSVEKDNLLEKLKNEIISSIESGITSTSRSFNMKPSNLLVKPLKVSIDENNIAELDGKKSSV